MNRRRMLWRPCTWKPKPRRFAIGSLNIRTQAQMDAFLMTLAEYIVDARNGAH